MTTKTETLADYVPYQPIKIGDKVVGLYAIKGNAEYWTARYLLSDVWEDKQIAEMFGCCEFYDGPGQSFAHYPSVYRSNQSTLVCWRGGLDI